MENSIKIEIGSRLKAIRQRLGLTLSELGQKAGVAGGFISQIERGLKKPSSEYLLYLANEGMNINWVLTGKGEMYSPTEQKDAKTKLGEVISFLETLQDKI